MFIVGEARSGTSIAHRSLLLHPSFALSDPSKSGLADSNAFVNPLHILDGFSPDSGLAEYLLNDAAIIEQLHQTIQRYRGPAKRGWKVYRAAKKFGLPAKPLWKLGKFPDILHAYFDAAQTSRGQKRLLEKSPDHNWCIPEIIWTYPQAKVIYITRDPVDTYASYHKRYQREQKLGKPEEEIAWLKPSIEYITTCLKNNWGMINKAHRQWPTHITTIRYEDFVGNYERVMGALLTWLDEEAIINEPEATETKWDADPQLMSGLRKKTESNDAVMTADEVNQVKTLMQPGHGLLDESLLAY